ncbi:MAG TPA: phosphatase PAP2 family protein [Actinocrinis sp.]|nr:phosphatase PAP2 family protein [Actinocrinis sp.]
MQRTFEETPNSRPEPTTTAATTQSPAAADPAGSARGHGRWWLAPVALLLGFGFLLWQVKTHGPITRMDLRLRDALQSDARDPSMSWMWRPARGMADLGDQTVALSALFVSTVLALRLTRSWLPVLVAAAAAAALTTVIPLKLWIDRPGPSQNVLGDAALGFFPSGHTADAVLCYGTSALLLCVFVIPRSPEPMRRYGRALSRTVTIGAAVLVLLTIFGLLWSNFHWLSDTLGSLCWCGAALLAIRHFTLTRLVPREQGREIQVPRG